MVHWILRCSRPQEALGTVIALCGFSPNFGEGGMWEGY